MIAKESLETNSSGNRKLKCPGEQPECSRCVNDSITCVYSTQKVMGRPRKRKIGDNAQPAIEPSQEARQQTSSVGSSALDSVIGFDPLADQISFSDMDLPNLDTINDNSLYTTSAMDHPGAQSCACLSSIYLTLENLRSMDSVNFPASLHCLRDALYTSKSCIDCQICPSQYFTATQNVQLLGTLLLCISERYNRILKVITLESTRAEGAGQMKTLHIDSLEKSEPRHENVGGIHSNDPLVLELPPSQWRKLARKVVKAEVHGTSDAGRISLMSILTSLEERQARWHTMEPLEDCPDPGRRRQDMHARNDNPMCLMLAREAKKVVNLFDFS